MPSSQAVLPILYAQFLNFCMPYLILKSGQPQVLGRRDIWPFYYLPMGHGSRILCLSFALITVIVRLNARYL
jgi:hypothetical protein